MPRSLTGGDVSFRINVPCAPDQNGSDDDGYLEDRVRCLEALVEQLTAEVRALQLANTSQADFITELTRIE